MSTRKQRDPLKERYWRRTLRDWQRSGLTIRAFCQQHGLAEPNFYAWRRLLAERDAEAPTFVPVQLLADPAAQPGVDAASGLEMLVGGRVLTRWKWVLACRLSGEASGSATGPLVAATISLP